MKVVCHTNLDDYKQEIWPSEMYNPQKGDKVKARSGKILEICQITHCEKEENKNWQSDMGGGSSVTIKQYLEIELHKIKVVF